MPLRRSKSLFGTDKLVEEGYLDPISLRKAHLVTSAMDDDDDNEEADEEHDDHKQNAQVGILGGENPEGSEANSPPCQGGPFSALTPSMWPSKGDTCIMRHNKEFGIFFYNLGMKNEEENDDDFMLEFDEFGFKQEFEDGPEESSSKLLSKPIQDNPQQRLKWLAHLEFAQTTKLPSPKHKKAMDDNFGSSKDKNNHQGPLTWNSMVEGITRTHKLRYIIV